MPLSSVDSGSSTSVGSPSRAGRYFTAFVRLFTGLGFTAFGLNGFLNFIPPPEEGMSPGAMAFFGALLATGYMMKLVAGTQLVVGVLLLINRFVPLALALLAPVIVNIVLFHVFLQPSGLGIALFVTALELYLAYAYRGAFGPMLRSRSTPG